MTKRDLFLSNTVGNSQVGKPINVIHHMNRMRDQSRDLLDAENAFSNFNTLSCQKTLHAKIMSRRKLFQHNKDHI